LVRYPPNPVEEIGWLEQDTTCAGRQGVYHPGGRLLQYFWNSGEAFSQMIHLIVPNIVMLEIVYG
jgi:hypothetical protein